MLVLKIIAVLGFLLGVVCLVVELRHKNNTSVAIFSTLIGVSIILFAVSIPAEKTIDEYKAAKGDQSEGSLDSVNAVESKAGTADAEETDANAFDLTNLDENETDSASAGNDRMVLIPVADDNEAPSGEQAVPKDLADELAGLEFPTGEPVAVDVPDDVQEPDNVQVPDSAAPSLDSAAPALDSAAPALDSAESAHEALPNDPLAPTAVAGKNIDDGKINEQIEFNGSKSKKKKAKIVSYEWDFGDGTKSSGKTVTHAYAKIGSYTATLTVTDQDNHVGIATRTIVVNRPESKIKFFEKKLPAQDGVTFDKQEGKYTKTFTGSQISLEASGYVSAVSGCKCDVVAEIEGSGCQVTKSKTLADGGEGDIKVKATCKSGLGEIQWRIIRRASAGCDCKFGAFEMECYEY